MEQVATYDEITRNHDEITRNQFKFSSDTTEYFFPVFPIRDHLDLKTLYRRFTISYRDRFNRFIRQIYDMKRDDNGNFELTYGNLSSHIYSNNHVVGTVILEMPEDETQRKRLEEYFNKFCTFFFDPNQHVTRAGGLAPIRF